MKLQKLIPVGILLLLSVATLSAQNSLPNPHDDACWSSLSALRACQLQAYDQALDQAQRCTSYPEYQCAPVAEPPAEKIAGKQTAKAVSKTASGTPSVAASPVAISSGNTQPIDSK
jgi:hypothetical protein